MILQLFQLRAIGLFLWPNEFYQTFESDHANSIQCFIQMKNHYISVFLSTANFYELIRKN